MMQLSPRTIQPNILGCKHVKRTIPQIGITAVSLIQNPSRKFSKPLLRTNLHSYPKISKKFVLRGYKYFSRVVSSGSMTIPFLKEIKKSSQIKMINYFEFDPYFTEASGIKPLVKILKKILMTKSLKFMIRRLESKQDTELLGPFIRKFLRLRRMSVEFVRVCNIDEEYIRKLNINFLKCYSVKFLEFSIIHLPSVKQRTFRETVTRLKHLHLLEDIKLHFNLIHTKAKSYDDVNFAFPKIPSLKRVQYLKGNNSEWTSMTGGTSEFMPSYLRSFINCQNLVEFSFKLEKVNLSTEVFFALTNTLSKLLQLRFLTLEFQQCQLEELEFMVFAVEISHTTHLEHLLFKLSQRPNVEADALCKFAECISTQKNLQTFDLYFQKMSLKERERKEIELFLVNLEGVEYILKAGSAHIFRKSSSKIPSEDLQA